MFEEYKYRLELHAHTTPASGCSEIKPEELADIYKNLGYDAVAVTNHFTHNSSSAEERVAAYMDDFRRTKAEGDKIGLTVLFGMEIRFTENSNDYLIYGVDETEALKIYSHLENGIAVFRKNYINPRSVLIQAHPFRNGMTEVDPEFIDGVEAFNMHPHHNSRVAVAAKYAKEHDMIATIGTDFHHHGHEGVAATLSKTLPKDSFELAELIKTRDYLYSIGGFTVLNNMM